jgi:hypothetical protein
MDHREQLGRPLVVTGVVIRFETAKLITVTPDAGRVTDEGVGQIGVQGDGCVLRW